MYKHSPLLETVLHNSERYSDKIAFVINGQSVSYGMLGVNIKKAAYILHSMGCRAGDRIVLSAHKDAEYLYLYFGSQMLGVVNVIVDAESNEERLEYIERQVLPRYCFGYNSKQFEARAYSELTWDTAEEFADANTECQSSDIAEIMFTTGTTGAPKGVCLSYNNIYASACNINEYIGNGVEDRELLALPICHSFGLGRIRCNLIMGATIVILGNFANIRTFLKAFEDYDITGFGVVPAAWAYIRKMSSRRISKFANKIRYIEIGSAAMPLETKKEMLEMFPNTRICMHYGLTESSRSCFQEFHDTEHLASIGRPVCEKVDVKIFNADGKELLVGEQGEICIKGNMVMSGYLSGQENQHAFWGEYFRTGDCGYKSADGYIYLLGREKEVINVGGKKVSPMEVEDVIISLGVGDCVCVPMQDNVMGEVVFCYIQRGSTVMSLEEIAEKVAGRLETYKRPVAYDWIDQIPTTESGKKQRLQIK